MFAMQPINIDLNTIFSDAGGEELQWLCSNVGSSFNNSISCSNGTNTMYGTPPQPSLTYNESITVTATDSGYSTATAFVYINVKVNHPPEIQNVTTDEIHCYILNQ